MNLLKARNEVRVWCRHRNHRTIWHAYDPISNDTLAFKSEEQLRTWLDNYDSGESPHPVRLWNGAGQNTNPLHFNKPSFTPMRRTQLVEETH
jgi:hypothetical protein